MTVQRLAHFPLAELRPVLESAGWDVTLDETLRAELRDAQGKFRLVVDRSGRAMLRRTAMAAKPLERLVHSGDHTYAIARETHTETHVSTQLAEGDDFGQVLDEMLALSLEDAGQAGG